MWRRMLLTARGVRPETEGSALSVQNGHRAGESVGVEATPTDAAGSVSWR
jgi:hypothetical protein